MTTDISKVTSCLICLTCLIVSDSVWCCLIDLPFWRSMCQHVTRWSDTLRWFRWSRWSRHCHHCRHHHHSHRTFLTHRTFFCNKINLLLGYTTYNTNTIGSACHCCCNCHGGAGAGHCHASSGWGRRHSLLGCGASSSSCWCWPLLSYMLVLVGTSLSSWWWVLGPSCSSGWQWHHHCWHGARVVSCGCWLSSSLSCGGHKGCQMSGWTCSKNPYSWQWHWHYRCAGAGGGAIVCRTGAGGAGCHCHAGAEGSVEGKMWLTWSLGNSNQRNKPSLLQQQLIANSWLLAWRSSPHQAYL